jgi:23S rRNA (uracil1939-C5)-methyltransferase
LRIGAAGDGIAEHAGETLYVPLTAPGDRARVRPGRARGDGHAAELVELLSPGPGRAQPPCAHFGQCGGCDLQHLAVQDYVHWKTNRLAQALERAGIHGGERAPVVTGSPGSRRRATFAAIGAGNSAILGFHVKRGTDVVDVTDCSVVDPRILSRLPALRALLGRLLKVHQRAEVTVTLLDGDLDVVLEWPGTLGLEAREALAAFAAAADVARLSWRPSAGVLAEMVVQLRPVGVVFAGVRVALPAGGFLQATHEGEQALVAAVLAAIKTAEQATGKPARAVADLFCGAGAFALPLARAGMRVHAIDADAALLQALTAARGTDRITAQQRDLFARPLSASELQRFDAVVFDPPRAGARAQAAELARSAVPVIAAVSCNPSTFARDARILADGGYRLETVTPVDQFLWSPHLELVAVFCR